MNQDDKLKSLRDILLKDEHEYVTSLEEKIKTLEDLITKQNNLSEHIDPILDKKLETFIKDMPKTLGPTITETLKSEIKNSQDAIVEALFPIIGKLIKRYVQKEIQVLSENINNSVNNTFSFKSFKRKFRSKKSGVSEGDLLIQDQFKSKIEQIMVIESGSGLIVSEYSKTNTIDQDTVAGMLTAIKSFAEDAFTIGIQNLEYIEYENYHIHLQNFSNYYIAVAISGAFTATFRSKLEDKLLDFAQNVINKTDLNNSEVFSTKLKDYFENENI
ncbi:cell envelope biogenesis protein OmpA [Olleya sp. HaHaR_3_96]|uniref:cell envelope biogenesis protein OmpA n=1 Tax=Olleya sp. HaHaR_3_96 TaxID=2745560 RepID=UPI001C4EAEB8|nr:cell envelope biogenesis protein OmpA [Olleya sp. HaHaR_3_96]QXP60964.1 cell envelope biogenesis protein OmpA [Olleya sp. HaHaR_3_96]